VTIPTSRRGVQASRGGTQAVFVGLKPIKQYLRRVRRYELVGRRRIELKQHVPVPRPGPSEVLVKVGACTVCNRSDLTYFHYLHERRHCADGCFGHEISGTVDDVGADVNRVKVGDRVFVRTPLTSGFADFAVAREIAVGRLPDHLPFERGAILQLLPLAIHATRGVRLGDRVGIVGQGPVGLMATQLARIRGAAAISVFDLDAWRLDRAASLGADDTNTVTGTAESFGPWRDLFDVTIDAVGTPVTAQACVDLVRQAGTVVFLGTHHIDTSVTFDLIQWERKGIVVHTAAEPTDLAREATRETAERLVSSSRELIHLTGLLTHTYPLEDLPAAIDRLSRSGILEPYDPAAKVGPPPEETLKVAITPT
jgi:L-iditol 2-dehydrogenase